MKRSNLLKRTMAGVITMCMLISLLPTSVLAAEAETATAEQAAIRQTLLDSVDSEEYPQGVFDFLTPRMETGENVGKAEFAIVRRGNTDEAASVTFKIIDMTAEYGKDYVLEVPGFFADRELAANPDAKPLYLEDVYTVGGGADPAGDDPDADKEDESAYADDTPDALAGDEPLGWDLQSARSALTGKASDRTTWREADEAEVSALTEAYGNMYDEVEGVEHVLSFAPGEYIKTLSFVTLEDEISEDEEQVLFVLCHPENCAISDNPTGFMNIVDDEEPEALSFGFTADAVTVENGSLKAELTVERLTGLYRYGAVEVFSAEKTAVEGVHYDGFAAELTFVPGQQYQKIEIPIKKHPALEDAEFLVYLGDYEDCASVVLRSGGEAAASPASGQDELMTMGTNDNLWKRSETVKPDVSSASPGTNYYTYSGNQNYWIININSYNQNSKINFNLDLSMVGKIKVTSEEYSEGTWYDDTWWLFGWHGKKGYYTDMWNHIDVNDRERASHRHKYSTTDTITLNDSDRKSGKVSFGTYVSGNCKKAFGAFCKNIELQYLPIEIMIGASDSDAEIQPKTYTSPNDAVNNGKSFVAGSLKFVGESASTTSKFFYNTDTVALEEAARVQADKTYLWGIKFETKAGSTKNFFYYEGTSFSIKDLYTGKLKDVNGNAIPGTAKLSDRINGEDFPCYKIFPVYKQKTAYTTIKIDGDKSQLANGTFKNEETIKTGILDSVQINIAGKGDWAVSGFKLACGNESNVKTTTAEQERALDKKKAKDGNSAYKTWSPLYRKDSKWALSIVNADSPTPGSFLFQPAKTHNSLEALYQKPEITVAVNPRSESMAAQSKGFAVYIDKEGNGQKAQYTELDSEKLLRGEEIHISPYRVGDSYQLIGAFNDASETGYKFQWQDFTGDTNHDGELSLEEIKALGNGYNIINKGVYAGDIFNFVPRVMGSPVLYYNIIPKAQNDTGRKNSLSGSIHLNSCSVIENTKLKPNYVKKPIANANITAGGESTVTDAEGRWRIESSSFAVGETYTVTLAYAGRSYTGDATVSVSATEFNIDEYNTFNVKNFNAYRVTNDSKYENVTNWNTHSISNSAISNEDKRHLYTFEIEELIPTTATVGRVEVKRYSAEGVLKKTYTAVYNRDSGVFEVKDPALLSSYTPGEDGPGAYIYSFNPATENVAPGDYLTVRVYDQYDVGYIEHDVGFVYKPKLSVLNIVNTFKSPLNPVVEFIGDVDMLFDLGLTAKMDNLDGTLADVVESKLDVVTDDNTRTISFGWNKDFKKSYDSEKSDKNKKDDKKNPEDSDAPKTAAEAVKAEAKSLEETSDQPGEDEDKKKKAADTAKKAVDKDSEDNEKTNKLTADMKVNLSVALELVMGYDSAKNRFYFQDFVVTGVVKGGAEAKYEYMTPIGIAIFVKGSLSGDITALMAVEPYYKNPAEPNYLYLDEAGKIDLTKLGNSDVNRQLSIYGKLMVRPKVTLSVGAAVLSDKLASITLTGGADFDMVFTTAGDGAGNVTLSANLTLSILNGAVEKKWLIDKKKYDMFSINGGTLLQQMSAGEDYRYDVITAEDTDKKLYLKNRGNWNDNSGYLSTNAAESYNEVILQTGIYPYAYPQIFMLSGGGENDYTGAASEQLLLFLDSDSEKTCLMYSVYQDSGDGRGYTWTQPNPVDANTAGDDTPRVEDIGDRLFITWSSQSRTGSDDPIEKLNSRNIKSVFFDKNTKRFSDVQYVTKTTAADKTADDFASASYYKAGDGTEELMVTYIKTQYKQTGAELVVGDLTDAYSTIAYRFYDFGANEWVDKYSDEERQPLPSCINGAAIEQLEENWYGQGFVDLSRYVTVTNTDLIIPENKPYAGLWSRLATDTDIGFASLGSDPKIVEHETINCGQYAVSAYLVDMDKSLTTIKDRDIFLQLYDFEEKTFYPAMRLTNDAYNQNYLELMDAPDGVTLYYISNGDIVKQNISDIVNHMIKAEVNGEKVLLQNKFCGYNSGESVILKADENNPYTEFIVNTDGNNVYLTWTESGISMKSGIDINSPEATQPENYYSERQMYMAMQTFTADGYQYTDENDLPLTYPAADGEGHPINWAVTPDINGEVGKVHAGDPVIKTVYSSMWTEPVQMTDEQGASFSDIDCVLIGDGYLRCVYLKGMSELTEIGGKLMPAENKDKRALVSSDFNLNEAHYTVSIDNADDVSAGREAMPVNITVKNESILTMSDVDVELYMIEGEEESSVGSAQISKLIGGGSETVTVKWDVPEALEGVSLEAAVSSGELDYAKTVEEFSYDALIEISDAYYELLDRNTAEFTVTVKNTGSENAANERVYINCGGVVSKSEEFDLVSGGTAMITLTADIPEETFEESRSETTITETAPLKVYTTGSVVSRSVVRSADASLEDLLYNVAGLTDPDGNLYSNTIRLDVGGMLLLSAPDNGDEANRARLAIKPEDEAVASVVNGVVIGNARGRTKLHAEVYPKVDSSISDESGIMRQVSNYNTLPSCLIQTMELDVLVGGAANYSSGSEPDTPAVVTEPSAETIKPKTKADAQGVAKATVEAKAVTDAVKNAAENKADSIVIKPEVTGNAKEVKVELPKTAVSEVANGTSAALVVETGKASVELPNDTLGAITEQAGGANVEIAIADKSVEDAGVKEAIAEKIGDADTANAAVAEITVSSGDKNITSFGGKSINASVSVDGKKNFTEGKKYLTLVISENGKRELLAGKCSRGTDGKLKVGVKVKHLSTFVVLDKELKSFADADAHWSADAVDYAVANGLMNGVSDKAFAPNATLNRAMLVTILYRLAGSPVAMATDKFTDVAAGQWYSDAVAWAAANGIVTGKTETTFAPMDNITREQFATMLMRYCKFAGLDTTAAANLGAFTDSASISSYAKDALAWANASGIITGRTATTIAPTGSATRGEAATMLMRFIQM